MINNPYDTLATELIEVQRTLGWMDLVIGNISDAVYVVDKKSRIVFANQYFSDLLETPRIFLLGKNVDDVFKISPNDVATKELLSTAVSGNSEAGIFNWQTKDTVYIFKISKKLITTTEQTVYLAQDVTREQQLLHMKNNFINLASHQLRTPMTSIMLHSHMLNDAMSSLNDTSSKKLTEGITKASERMIRLINDILHITKIQNDVSVQSHNEIISIPEIAKNLEDEVRPAMSEKNMTFIVKVADNIPDILSNKSSVCEILSNLLTNATQYTPAEGTISLKVTTNDDTMIIKVKDNGIGIPKEAMPLIFDQFSRAENAFQVFNEGTGLGLYLVKLLLIPIGGTIACNSKIGKGTTFTVKLPLRHP